MRILLCCLLGTAIDTTLFGQIINVESQRVQKDTTGWFGNLGTRFLFEKNAVKIININVTAYLEYQTPKNVFLGFANYNLLEGNNKALYNNTFYHVRYNYKWNRWLHWEVFTQLQRNDITGINRRRLAGTGPRFKIASGNKFILHAATAMMFENEREQTTPVIIHNDIRSSSYVSLNFRPNSNTEIMGTVFWQPLLRYFPDYRVLNEITSRFKIDKHLSVRITWYYLHDSEPARISPKYNYSISNGIEYKF